jgi:hypothetical protein
MSRPSVSESVFATAQSFEPGSYQSGTGLASNAPVDRAEPPHFGPAPRSDWSLALVTLLPRAAQHAFRASPSAQPVGTGRPHARARAVVVPVLDDRITAAPGLIYHDCAARVRGVMVDAGARLRDAFACWPEADGMTTLDARASMAASTGPRSRIHHTEIEVGRCVATQEIGGGSPLDQEPAVYSPSCADRPRGAH